MTEAKTEERTRPGRCPTHGDVQAVKELPVFVFPGLFWGLRYLRAAFQPYRCPQCGEKVAGA